MYPTRVWARDGTERGRPGHAIQWSGMGIGSKWVAADSASRCDSDFRMHFPSAVVGSKDTSEHMQLRLKGTGGALRTQPHPHPSSQIPLREMQTPSPASSMTAWLPPCSSSETTPSKPSICPDLRIPQVRKNMRKW